MQNKEYNAQDFINYFQDLGYQIIKMSKGDPEFNLPA